MAMAVEITRYLASETSCIDLSLRINDKIPEGGTSTYVYSPSLWINSIFSDVMISFLYCMYLTEFDRLTEGLLQAEGPGVELDLQQINIYTTLLIPDWRNRQRKSAKHCMKNATRHLLIKEKEIPL
jgi:hypothetical protein